jgi:hypothetical protein
MSFFCLIRLVSAINNIIKVPLTLTFHLENKFHSMEQTVNEKYTSFGVTVSAGSISDSLWLVVAPPWRKTRQQL